jgi:cytochrome c oxidase subunit 2
VLPDGALVTFAAHSPQARSIARVFEETLAVSGAVFFVVATFVAICVVRFRAREHAAEPPQTLGHRGLEVAWTVGPLLVVSLLLVRTAQTMAATDPPADREPDLTIVAHQWWWEARYRSGAVTANEIHVPVGRNLLVAVESADVIHDFWVPQLGRKIDAIPGHPAHVWMQADEPGTYAGACAEYCGDEHAWMRIAVVAEAAVDFDAWERHIREPAAAPSNAAALRGATTFRQSTCVDCHRIAGVDGASGGSHAAPDLTHLADRKTLAAGVLANDRDHLVLWLEDPQRFKPESHMPSLQLTDAQADDLASYLETLR